VLDADEIADAIEVVEHVIDGRGLLVADEHPDSGDAHDTAPLGHRPDRFVGLRARVPGERTAVRVCDEGWLSRDLDRIESGAIAAVREVDDHPDRIHLLDDCDAEIAEPAINPFRRTVSKKIPPVVGELRDPLAQPVESLHIVYRAEMLGILKPDDDA